MDEGRGAKGAPQPPARTSDDGVADDPRRAALIDTRLAAVAARFGERWDAAQRERVRRQIERQVELAERLRRLPLGNGDEPEIVFVPNRTAAEREERPR